MFGNVFVKSYLLLICQYKIFSNNLFYSEQLVFACNTQHNDIQHHNEKFNSQYRQTQHIYAFDECRYAECYFAECFGEYYSTFLGSVGLTPQLISKEKNFFFRPKTF
jgi:hypothetical protein